MIAQLPQVTHLYQNHLLDSTQWEHFVPRGDDIVIATPYKSGTTWMQTIVMHLVFGDLQNRPLWSLSPWLDHRPSSTSDKLARLDQQEHRRFIKTHLPLDGLPYFAQVKYIVVGRDARDVFMSLWNHYRHFNDESFQRFNTGLVGQPLPPCPEDIRDFWGMWMGGGWFEWESEGYPFWSNLRHIQTWWNFRHLPNILLVHYSDLLTDLVGEIQRIAHFLGIPLTPELAAQIAEMVTFENVKQHANELLPGMDYTFIGGAQTFLNKGKNGRWRGLLTDEDLALYEAAVARELSPDCAFWLENGRLHTP